MQADTLISQEYSSGCAKSLQSCPTLCDAMDHSPPGFSVHGILQARIWEWVAVSFSKGSSQPRDRTCLSYASYIGKWVLYHQCHLGSPLLQLPQPKRARSSLGSTLFSLLKYLPSSFRGKYRTLTKIQQISLNTNYKINIAKLDCFAICCCYSVHNSSLTLCDPHGLQYTRLF